MTECRLSWSLALLDVPIDAVDHLVRNILTTGAGSVPRLAQSGPIDVPSATHILQTWFREHGQQFTRGAQNAVKGIISWLRQPDAETAPDLYSTAAALVLLSYGSFERKISLLFSLFAFSMGGPRAKEAYYRGKVESPDELILAPSELALLVRSVCAGLSGIGLGTAFAPPGMDALSQIAADALQQINSTTSDSATSTIRAAAASTDPQAKRGLTKKDFRLWIGRSPLAVAGLERMSLLPRLRLVIRSIETITDQIEVVHPFFSVAIDDYRSDDGDDDDDDDDNGNNGV